MWKTTPISRDGFRILITIFRGSSAGRALSMMARGVQCEADTLERSAVLVDEFLDAADAILSGPLDPGITFGVINVINLREGIVQRTEVLKSK